MVTSHGTIQEYNGQELVDSKDQVIIHAEAFGESQDLHLIPTVLDRAKENLEGWLWGRLLLGGGLDVRQQLSRSAELDPLYLVADFF